MGLWTKKYFQWLIKVIVILMGVVLLKVIEMTILQRLIYWYWDLPVNSKDEFIDIIVLILIMIPFTFIVMNQKKTLRESDEKYKILAENSLIGIYTVHNGKITYANQQFIKMTGYTRDEIIGMDILNLVHPEDQSIVAERMRRKLEAEEKSATLELRGIKKDGSIINVEIHGAVTIQNGEPQIIGSILDITERKSNENVLKDFAFKDSITGLPNRRFFEQDLISLLAILIKNKEMAAIMFLDLDEFKSVNDSLGHEVGDDLLKDVAVRLLSCVRTNDTVYRLGGDEFIIFLRNINNTGAVKVANRIVKDINKPFNINNNKVIVSTSVGIAFFPDHGAEIKTLMKNADAAMYQAKKQGKNTYFIYNS